MKIGEIKGLSLRYLNSREYLLPSLNFSIKRGEKALITGPSGVGKSSLLFALRGVIPFLIPAEVTGEIKLFGKSITPENLPYISTDIGLLLQNYESQFFGRTVEEEFELSGINFKKFPQRDREIIEALEISPLLDRDIKTLSSGEKQRVLLTVFVLRNKSLLLLDEPFSNIDQKTERKITDLLNSLISERTSLLLSMNSLKSSLKPDRVFVVTGDGDFFAETGSSLRGKANFYEARGIRIRSLPRLGKIVSNNGLPPIMSARNLVIKFGKREILKNVDLDLYPGTATVLIGENGSGKTTLAKILSGFLKPLRGNVFCCGKKLRGPSSKRVQIVFQNPLNQLFLEKTEQELKWMNHGNLEKIDFVLSLFDLEKKREFPVYSLSWGEKQRLAVGAALLADPQVLILDEPTHGQDLKGLFSLYEALQKLKNEGKAILLITLDWEVAHAFADRIYELKKGLIYERSL